MDRAPELAAVSAAETDEPDLAAALREAQRGDEGAFRILYRDMQPRLLRYVRVMVGNEAEDVASEAWLHVARGLAAFSGDYDGFRGWAATIARHQAADHLRRSARRPPISAVPVEELTGIAGSDDTAVSVLDALSTDAAIALITKLPRTQAEAVLLRTVMGLDAKRAGKVLGRRAGAVRTADYRGLRRLARYLAE